MSESDDNLLQRFAGRAGYALALRGVWALVNFAGAALLARWFSARDYGSYASVLSLVTFLSIVCALGAPYALVRLLGEFGGERPTPDQASRAKGALTAANTGALAASMTAALLIAVGAELLGQKHLKADPIVYVVGAALLPAFTLTDVQAAAARSYGHIFMALGPKDVLWRLLLIPLGLWATMTLPPDQQLIVFLGAAAVGLTVFAGGQALLLRRVLPAAVREARPTLERRDVAKVAGATWIAQVAAVVFRTLDVVIAGFFLSPAHAGLYFAASRVAGLISFVLVSTDVVVGPEVAKLHFAGEPERLTRTLKLAVLIVFIPSLFAFLGCILFADQILSLFGPAFRAAKPELIILAFGQLVNAATGAGGLVLIMTGQERKNAEVVVTTSIASIIAMAVLTPLYGTVGTAIATSAGVIVWNLRVFSVARRHTAYDPSIFGLFRRPAAERRNLAMDAARPKMSDARG